MNEDPLKRMGQGPAKKADEHDLARDKWGFTSPNLHRRIDPQYPETSTGELLPRDYQIGIYQGDSYRTTSYFYHDEESTYDETP